MVDLLQGGKKKALEWSSTHVRVYVLIIIALDDHPIGVHHLDACTPGVGGSGSNNEHLTLLDI